MGRLLFALFVGLLVQGVLVFAIESMGALLHPLPAGLDVSNAEQLRAYMESGEAPFTALLMVVFAYAVGAFGGGFVATKLAPRRGLMPALVIGQIALVLVVINLFAYPHPVWMMIASVVVPLPSAWLGGRAAHARGGLK
jgi:MFS family permease